MITSYQDLKEFTKKMNALEKKKKEKKAQLKIAENGIVVAQNKANRIREALKQVDVEFLELNNKQFIEIKHD